MDWLFRSGHAADLILAVLAAEALWLGRAGRRHTADALLMLLPAVLIVIALRGALTGAHWLWIALPLALSFPAHLIDLARRKPGMNWTSSRRKPGTKVTRSAGRAG